MTRPDPFRAAARAYLAYGLVYLVGGSYLVAYGVGVRGPLAAVAWVAVGAGLVLAIPYLLAAPRGWFERWVLSRRDFARIVAVLMAVRALKVGQVAVRPETASVPLPLGGAVSFRVGAALFFVVTVVALVLVARAAWSRS
jgi:hypothetical protein